MLSEALVEQVILASMESGQESAQGVQSTSKKRQRHIVNANQEVILIAGMFQSPQILGLSSVGQDVCS